MLINCTDSPSKEWTPEKLSAAKDKFGLITDKKFPKVNDKMADEDIDQIADESFDEIMLCFDESEDMTHDQAVFLDEDMALDKRIKIRLDEAEIYCIDFEEI